MLVLTLTLVWQTVPLLSTPMHLAFAMVQMYTCMHMVQILACKHTHKPSDVTHFIPGKLGPESVHL